MARTRRCWRRHRARSGQTSSGAVTAVDLQLDALEAADGDTAVVARDEELRSKLTAPEYAQAAERVREYIGEHCGVDGRGLG